MPKRVIFERNATLHCAKTLAATKEMTDHPIATRDNISADRTVGIFMSGGAIVLFFVIFQSLVYNTVSFNLINISGMIGVLVLIIRLEKRGKKTISIYPDYIILGTRTRQGKKFNNRDIYLNIVNHPSSSMKSTRTLQLRRKGGHRKIISIEPLDEKDDKYLENLLRHTCKIKVDNWVE